MNPDVKMIAVDVYEDFVCPWCRIGRANLRSAAARLENGRGVHIRHRPFLLDPTIAPEGEPFMEHLARKFSGNDHVALKFEPVIEMGMQAGVTFRFDLITRAPNTIRAHRLVEIAPEHVREAIVDDLFDRYFEHGQDIGDPDVLADIARLHVMETQQVYGLMSGDDPTRNIINSLREAQEIGITGVPFFVVQSMYAVAGAQPPDTLLTVLNMASEPDTIAPN
jgi:predicted DsbA family dithiol-disulfide isomerase